MTELEIVAARMSAEAAAQLGPRRLGLEQRRELLEREPEQVTQAHDLPHPIDVGLRKAAVLTLLAPAPPRQQADLLVVADRPWRGPGQPGHLADAKRGT